MNIHGNTQLSEKSMVGTRPHEDVESAHRDLAARTAARGASRQFSLGAAAAYEWALGRTPRSPVTGAACGGGAPDLRALTAEADAAHVQTEDLTNGPGPHKFGQGVYGALAWVCGHSDQAP